MPMTLFRSGCLLVALSLAALSADAQAPQRVRGTVSGFDGRILSVNSGKGDVRIEVGDKTEIIFTQPISIQDIKPGDFLGVTSAKSSDGALTAFEVRRFPKPLNPGHRPFDGRDDQTMTNATVSSVVQSTSARELTLAYEGGSQKIMVSEKAAISMLVPGQRSQLVPGAAVNLTARPGPGGGLMANRIQVGAPKK
jgi:hypothetical protein